MTDYLNLSDSNKSGNSKHFDLKTFKHIKIIAILKSPNWQFGQNSHVLAAILIVGMNFYNSKT